MSTVIKLIVLHLVIVNSFHISYTLLVCFLSGVNLVSLRRGLLGGILKMDMGRGGDLESLTVYRDDNGN